MKKDTFISVGIGVLAFLMLNWQEKFDLSQISHEFYAICLLAILTLIAFYWLYKEQGLIGSKIDAKHDELKDEIDKILDVLETIKANPVFREPVSGHSPLQISDLGMKISNQINAKAIAQAHESEVEVDVQASDYAKQKACMVFATEKLFENLDEEHKALIEQAAYDEGLEIEQVLRVIGVHLRDLIFARQNASRS